jgi:transposase
MLHKVRKLLVRQRTMLINALRGHLAELGIVRARGHSGVKAVIETLHETQNGSTGTGQGSVARLG